MSRDRTRRRFVAGVAAGAVGAAGCLGDDVSTSSPSSDTDEGATDDGSDGDGDEQSADTGPDLEWRTDDAGWASATLEDVTTGDQFTIESLDRPALVHTFAIWCSTCQRQHESFDTFRTRVGDAAVPVELNVDPNEDAEAIREHADGGGFDWPFALSPQEVTQALVEDFGTRMTSPPQSPVILVCPDGEFAVLDDTSVVAAEALERAVDAC